MNCEEIILEVNVEDYLNIDLPMSYTKIKNAALSDSD